MFRFLGETRHLGDPPDWSQPDASVLWRFHLHYFRWAWSLGAHPDREWAQRSFRELWRSWRAHTTVGSGEAWAPYVVSIRTWVLCALFDPLVRGTPLEREMAREIAVHARYVRAHLEQDLGGNHLVANLKALVGSGIWLRDEKSIRTSLRLLDPELSTQVLPDGGHFERSPSYHCEVLADLVDIAARLVHAERPVPSRLESSISRMRRWLGTILMPDGDVPLFNDCVMVGRERIAALAPSPPPKRRLVHLADSGFLILAPTPSVHLVVDVGATGARGLPGHAHAGCLTFELALNGRRFVVDVGTTTYQAGPRRAWERSTAAHNTVEIDGLDQAIMWGEFRVARRATVTVHRLGDDGERLSVEASHDGYRRLDGSPVHARTIEVDDAEARIADKIEGDGTHDVVLRFNVSTEHDLVKEPEGYAAGGIRLILDGEGEIALSRVDVGRSFGVVSPASVISVRKRSNLPVTFETRIRWNQASVGNALRDGAPQRPSAHFRSEA